MFLTHHKYWELNTLQQFFLLYDKGWNLLLYKIRGRRMVQFTGVEIVFLVLAVCIVFFGLIVFVVRSYKSSLENLIQKNTGQSKIIAKYEDEMEKLKDMSCTDSLTGLLNRRGFDLAFASSVSLLDGGVNNRHNSGGGPVCLLMIDVDFFKKVNDTYGHSIGDLVLKEISKTIKQTLRDTDIVARYGGEEIAAILPGLSLKEAVRVAEKVRRSVFEIDFEIESLCVTASIGLASASSYEEGKSLIDRADSALFGAKDNGRDQVIVDS